MTVTIQKPSQGRVVIFTDADNTKNVAFIDKFVGGVVNGVDTGSCDLVVLPNHGDPNEVFYFKDIPHDDAQGPETWRFPKHESATIEVER